MMDFVTVTNEDHWSKVSNIEIKAGTEAEGLICRNVSPIQMILPVRGAVHSVTTGRQNGQSTAFKKIFNITTVIKRK